MEWFEYLIIVSAILFVGLVIFFGIRNKIKGKGGCEGCSGNCSSCKGSCSKCNKLLEEYKKEQNKI